MGPSDGESQVEFASVAVWNVVFLARADRLSWWDWFTPPAWRHVLAFGYAPAFDGFLVVDPGWYCMRVTPVTCEGMGAWLAEHGDEITEVRQIEAGEAASWPAHVGFWCTVAIKRLIGLRSGAFTPLGLRGDLVRAGARRVFYDESPTSPPGGS